MQATNGSNKKQKTMYSCNVQRTMMKALKDVRKNEECGKFGIDVVQDDMTRWALTFPSVTFIEDAPEIFKGLEKNGDLYNRKPEIKLELNFPPQFPDVPPFVRVRYPRFQYKTGHVTVGGSICTSKLTMANENGWESTDSMANTILLLHATLIDGEAIIVNSPHQDPHHPCPEQEYSDHEARIAFQRVAWQKGWNLS